MAAAPTVIPIHLLLQIDANDPICLAVGEVPFTQPHLTPIVAADLLRMAADQMDPRKKPSWWERVFGS